MSSDISVCLDEQLHVSIGLYVNVLLTVCIGVFFTLGLFVAVICMSTVCLVNYHHALCLQVSCLYVYFMFFHVQLIVFMSLGLMFVCLVDYLFTCRSVCLINYLYVNPCLSVCLPVYQYVKPRLLKTYSKDISANISHPYLLQSQLIILPPFPSPLPPTPSSPLSSFPSVLQPILFYLPLIN